MIKKTRKQFYVEMGFRIRQVRSLNKISQERLGEKLSVSKQTIQRYESGEIHIPSDAIHICAHVLNTPVNFFYGDETSPAPSNTNRVGLMVAAEIMDLPDDNVRRSIYQLARSINRAGNKASLSQKRERESA